MYVYLISKAQVQLYQYILSSEEERAQEEYLVAGPCWEEDSVLTYSGVGRVLQTDSQSGQLSSHRKPFLSNMGMGFIQRQRYENLNCFPRLKSLRSPLPIIIWRKSLESFLPHLPLLWELPQLTHCSLHWNLRAWLVLSHSPLNKKRWPDIQTCWSKSCWEIYNPLDLTECFWRSRLTMFLSKIE